MRLDQAQLVFAKATTEWLLPLLIEMPKWGIDELNEQASCLAQFGHETRGFTRFEEDLYYGQQRLLAVWPRRFYLAPDEPRGARRNAAEYAGRPARLAEFVYGGRMENGPEGSGDGWRHHGRGHCMLTGKRNHRLAQEATGIPVMTHPELMLTPSVSATVSCHFWKSNGFDAIDDDQDIRAETRLLNGGDTGLADRERYFKLLLKVQQ